VKHRAIPCTPAAARGGGSLLVRVRLIGCAYAIQFVSTLTCCAQPGEYLRLNDDQVDPHREAA